MRRWCCGAAQDVVVAMPTAGVWRTDTCLPFEFDNMSAGVFTVLAPSCLKCQHSEVFRKGRWKAARALDSGYNDVAVFEAQPGDMQSCGRVSTYLESGRLFPGSLRRMVRRESTGFAVGLGLEPALVVFPRRSGDEQHARKQHDH